MKILGQRCNGMEGKTYMADSSNVQPGFAQAYPQLAWWVRHQGWIEMGYDERNESFIRALDLGGMP